MPRPQREDYDSVIADLEKRIQSLERYVAYGSQILDTYVQEGQNGGYAACLASGSGVYVNAAQTIPLRWVYTPPMDVWADVQFHVGILDKLDAVYNYMYLNGNCSPAPEVSNAIGHAILTQHIGVDRYGFRTVRRVWGLKAGVSYTMSANFSGDGGTWQYYQGADHLWMIGKSWIRKS